MTAFRQPVAMALQFSAGDYEKTEKTGDFVAAVCQVEVCALWVMQLVKSNVRAKV